MNVKTYTLQEANKAGNALSLTYGYSLQFRKWAFQTPNSVVLVSCKGGEQAHKVARVIMGALKRSGSYDNMARANVNSLVR
jgi:hypothetical protein